ncbi:hypothetical protein HAQ01_04660 [Acidithiobacillus thiooxidans]|uniref:hypothetical protein n=1 Tax=Acidithiobacillus thiooxidans TaxID=930 RepID=UPI001145CD6F|nr:hypothetical protein [Acidithiobacillus thiooxidans]MBU2792714.1 hypothetical protein [Acidithiobacillus thiooxidans]
MSKLQSGYTSGNRCRTRYAGSECEPCHQGIIRARHHRQGTEEWPILFLQAQSEHGPAEELTVASRRLKMERKASSQGIAAFILLKLASKNHEGIADTWARSRMAEYDEWMNG